MCSPCLVRPPHITACRHSPRLTLTFTVWSVALREAVATLSDPPSVRMPRLPALLALGATLSEPPSVRMPLLALLALGAIVHPHRTNHLPRELPVCLASPSGPPRSKKRPSRLSDCRRCSMPALPNNLDPPSPLMRSSPGTQRLLSALLPLRPFVLRINRRHPPPLSPLTAPPAPLLPARHWCVRCAPPVTLLASPAMLTTSAYVTPLCLTSDPYSWT